MLLLFYGLAFLRKENFCFRHKNKAENVKHCHCGLLIHDNVTFIEINIISNIQLIINGT